ncbi:unnamed protein product, partial [Sphacelaria rigidula]
QIPKTVEFISKGAFKRVALQFPDSLLREAPEVLWTLQARVRKLVATTRGSGSSEEKGPLDMGGLLGAEGEPLIFVTGDTSYGSCCVDEVSAQHLKADAIVHYGRACLSPTNSSVPVLYVFGRGSVDVQDLASTLLSGPLAPSLGSPVGIVGCGARDENTPQVNMQTTEPAAGEPAGAPAPVLLLYDVRYAHAIPALLESLEEEYTRRSGGASCVGMRGLVVGYPTPQEYSPPGTSGGSTVRASAAGDERGTNTETVPSSCKGSRGGSVGPGCVSDSSDDKLLRLKAPCCASGAGVKSMATDGGCGHPRIQKQQQQQRDENEATLLSAPPKIPPSATTSATRQEQQQEPENTAGSLPSSGTSPSAAISATEQQQQPTENVAVLSSASESPAGAPPHPTSTRNFVQANTPPKIETPVAPTAPPGISVRIGGLGVEVESEESLKGYTVFFVGSEGRQLTNILLRCAGCRDRLRYDPSLPKGRRLAAETGRGNRDLMRR